MSDIQNDYSKALGFVDIGEYEKARQLLIKYDHPQTNKLLDKVNTAIAAGHTSKKGFSIIRFLAAIVLAVIILMLIGFLMNGVIVIPV